MDGKADAGKAAYVSIQSENKPGLYITAQNSSKVMLSQDTDGLADTSAKQTFRSVKGLDDERVFHLKVLLIQVITLQYLMENLYLQMEVIRQLQHFILDLMKMTQVCALLLLQ